MAIDGKMLRRSFDWATGKGAIHMVGAGAAANCLISGQRKVEEKSNEIKAISALSEQLDLEGFLVTIDATGCQKEVARTIMEQRADYVLALKGNQGALHGEVQIFFTWAHQHKFATVPHHFYCTVDGNHRRLEERRY